MNAGTMAEIMLTSEAVVFIGVTGVVTPMKTVTMIPFDVDVDVEVLVEVDVDVVVVVVMAAVVVTVHLWFTILNPTLHKMHRCAPDTGHQGPWVAIPC